MSDDPRELLRQEQETNLLLAETIADLELAVEDAGWNRMSAEGNIEFTGAARRQLTSLCRTVAVANPLVKRGVMLRIAYIWGGGVELAARDPKVQDVIQQFWDDNYRSLSGSQAQEELERALATDGNVYLAGFTSALTGRVQVRSIAADEIKDIVCNPEDSDEPWFYVREYTRKSLGADAGGSTSTVTQSETVKEVYPALGYAPASRIKNLNGDPVKWDAPMLHVAVNRLDGWHYGVPDVYASLAWAKAYKDFLTDWALLTKSLAKFAWRSVSDSKSRANRAITAIRASVDASSPINQPSNANTAGQVVGMGPGTSLEAIPKSGANIDAGSGKPLAAMVASGLGVPVTLLLADPGVTGARAVAETLDQPTALEMSMRRLLWQGQIGQLLDYVIDQAVIAPKGPLKGTVTVDSWDRRVVKLAGGDERTVDFNWPELSKEDPVQLINAIAVAAEWIPDETTVRLLLNALGVDDVDELVDEMKDPSGDFVPKAVAAVNSFQAGGPPTPAVGQAAANAAKVGKDPAAVVGSDPKARESVLEADRVYHWKHGWIPLDHAAASEGLSPEQLGSALNPSTSRSASAITKDLEKTAEGRDLVASIKGFTETRGGVANLRSNIAKTLDGTASEPTQRKIRAFVSAMNNYPTKDVPPLYRGIAVKVEEDSNAWWDAFEAKFKPGSTITFNASSFSSSEKKAAEFERMINGTRKAGSNHTAVRFVIEGQTHALPVQQLSKFKSEKEWLAGGEYEVVRFTQEKDHYRVVIRQRKPLVLS